MRGYGAATHRNLKTRGKGMRDNYDEGGEERMMGIKKNMIIGRKGENEKMRKTEHGEENERTENGE